MLIFNYLKQAIGKKIKLALNIIILIPPLQGHPRNKNLKTPQRLTTPIRWLILHAPYRNLPEQDSIFIILNSPEAKEHVADGNIVHEIVWVGGEGCHYTHKKEWEDFWPGKEIEGHGKEDKWIQAEG